jgi:hypothetical protein
LIQRHEEWKKKQQKIKEIPFITQLSLWNPSEEFLDIFHR